MRAGFRLAWVTAALGLVIFVAALFARGWVSAWPREAMFLCVCSILALPLYMFGFTILTRWMAKALHGPTGRSRLKVALVGAASWLFMLLWVAGLTFRAWPEWDIFTMVLIPGWLAVTTPWFPYALAQSSHLRMRYHEEWAPPD